MSFAGLPEQPEARRLLASAVAEGPRTRTCCTGRREWGSELPPARSPRRCSARSGASSAGTHPDLFTLEALGEMIRIDEIRALHRDLHMRPYEADRRVYLIFDAHLLNEDAADALLKDLEEPPPYAVIVLVADELGPLPPTIRSRCQLVPFRRLSEQAVRAYLAERAPGLSETEARVARAGCRRQARPASSGCSIPRPGRGATSCCGSRARRIADPAFEPAEAAASLLDAARARGAAAKAQAEEELEGIELPAREAEQRVRRVQRGAEREELLASLEELASWYRDLVVVAAGAEQAVVHADRLAELREDATRERGLDAETRRRDRSRASGGELEEFNLNPSLALEALFVRLQRAFSGSSRSEARIRAPDVRLPRQGLREPADPAKTGMTWLPSRP